MDTNLATHLGEINPIIGFADVIGELRRVGSRIVQAAWNYVPIGKKMKLGAYAMKRVAAGAHHENQGFALYPSLAHLTEFDSTSLYLSLSLSISLYLSSPLDGVRLYNST